MFIFIEAVLGTMVLFLAFLMLREKNVDKSYQISVIVENADDTQWSAFKYGLKMAAEDKGAEMVMVSTGASLSQEEEKKLIEEEKWCRWSDRTACIGRRHTADVKKSRQ